MKTETQDYKISEVVRRIDDIDLDPFFQRTNVWSKSRQQYFIDTIIRGWGVPKFYLYLKGIEFGNEKYACVDGKQRLTAIYSFLTGGFELSALYSDADIAYKKYSDLPRVVQDKINDYVLTIEIVKEATDEQLSELFKRLQFGVSLNSAEKLFSIPNQMNQFIKNITNKKLFKDCIKISNKRYAHHAIATQICCLALSGSIKSLKYSNLEDFVMSWPKFNSTGHDAKQIVGVIDYMYKVFGDNSQILQNRANIISFYLIISDLIKRQDISGQEKDLKIFFENFVNKVKKVRESNEKKMDPTDFEFLKYQNSVIQSADSSTSIKVRHKILVSRLASYSEYYEDALGANTDKEKFKKLYDDLESKKATSPSGFDKWLISNIPKIRTIKVGRSTKTLPVHVRHSISHPKYPKYTHEQLKYSIKVLSSIN